MVRGIDTFKEFYKGYDLGNLQDGWTLEIRAEHIIVATHHVPSYQLVSPRFIGSPINGAFTAEMGNFMAYSNVDYWIYGHSHVNIDKMIGNTRCVSNQLGYVCHSENKDFNPSKYIEL